MSEQATTTLEQQIKMALARGYCYPENSHKELDGTLADAMTAELVKIMPAEIGKLQKDVDDLTRAYAKQIQLIVDVTNKVRTIIGIEPIEFVKKELEELKEVLLTHMEESAK